MVTNAPPPKVDALDVRLISQLEINPRQSYQDLAVTLNVDASTVQRRVKRLIDQRIIFLDVELNTVGLGYHVVVLGLNVSPGHVDTVAEGLARQPNVEYVMITSGPYDIMAWSSHRDSEDLFDFITGDLAKIPNISGVEVMPLLRLMKSSWSLLGDNSAVFGSHRIARTLDEDDWAMLATLEDNPRLTHTYLAERLKSSRPTASAKLQGLLNEGVARIICRANRNALGYGLQIGTLMRVQPSRILDVAERLVSNRAIHHVLASSGRYDLIAWASFKNSDEVSTFLRIWLGSVSGITAYETALNLGMVKGSASVRSLMPQYRRDTS